ncbi:DUF619-domain-containing protein [Cylindrobasidium torrendii FP15055 ss-10]|uniref:Amino-acid acetyltransferase, mitochondrial n=1 Tax=Cylindrobasidium torrendii FP15055 ss-10 TaxID=1314674 RepID=A0A0D7BKS8_9AGAR|nr:DUF619-domain-containing protein [Cylindrobasidium torrendii FP15055 ss-10]
MLSLASSSCRAAQSLQSRRGQAYKAFYATIRSLRQPAPPDNDEPLHDNDFILSILRANPSARDSRGYLASFGPRPRTGAPPSQSPDLNVPTVKAADTAVTSETTPTTPIIDAILDPVVRRTSLVKIQGPFTDLQLESIARGMVYLEKLGLVSVIVVDVDINISANERSDINEEVMRVCAALERQGARARPVLGAFVRLGPHPDAPNTEHGFEPPEAHTIPSDLSPIKSALSAGDIPVLPPFALDSFCRSVRINANDITAALARGMAEAAKDGSSRKNDVDLMPLRVMIINREGGIPSYARSGLPHLLVNIDSEYDHIKDTFSPGWRHTHPTSLDNLALARKCLAYMPPTSSAVMVSHRSPSSLIANLITNRPAVSSSLPHALLQGNRKLTPHTPTLIRRGMPIRVVRTVDAIDQAKMTNLLEKSFNRVLDTDKFYARLQDSLDFVIVAGDYAGAAIVTNEPSPNAQNPISYLDKFAVLPSHQGDGTVDFLWVALHDESYGLGHPSSANPNGGKGGEGEGRDLVWRSRANNPVNKWYFERSTGHMRMGDWVLFWCDAEKQLKIEQGRRWMSGLSYVEDWESGRLDHWGDVVMKIPSAWK